MVVPSHFTPLAAPGAIGLGLRWLLDPGSPFYIRPRLDPALSSWIVHFARAANREHVERAGPVLRDMLLASRELYEQLADRCDNGFGLVKRGLLMLCRTRAGLEEETRPRAARASWICRWRSSRRRALPRSIRACAWKSPARCSIRSIVISIRACSCASSRSSATAAGVTIRWSTRVDGWRTVGERIAAAQTSQGELAADEFVLAAGAWSAEVLRAARLQAAAPGRQGLQLHAAAIRRSCPGCRAILSEAHVAVTPMGASLRIGGTMEFAGLDRSVSVRRTQAIAAAAAQLLSRSSRAGHRTGAAVGRLASVLA